MYSNYGIDLNDLYVDQILCIPVAPSPVRVSVIVRERRLIVYRNGSVFKTFNIAFNNPSNTIPKGAFTVLNKQVDTGEEYGARWIGLSKSGFGIHGTNTPEFINVVATGNNIVMSNQNISELFNLVPVGTAVSIE